MKAKCIVFKARAQGKDLTNSDLEQLKTTIPLAAECLICPRLIQNKLVKECHKDL